MWRLNADPQSRERPRLPVKDLPVQEAGYELQRCVREDVTRQYSITAELDSKLGI